ncbi:DUF1212-domain-containing protein [Cylindrobasidium torrendii FP15055 ss-10]|uniref:DUF1212-domain-containing protein n=1 Tax=Cylindrobasidium torrendii FP15055 ss-10 TaxID=1314674 RepID=A0A0D7AZ65_9AGAR|nr:DUF1212-domain-containing protein [Cylindrobasidium torrendii FP15055 ss-10]
MSPSREGNSGNKTPRKVQWVDSTPSPVHELDERGLDPNAFDYFTDALKRHQSMSSTASPTREQTVSPDPTTVRNTAANATTSNPPPGPRIHHFPPRASHLPPITTELTQYQRETPPSALPPSTSTMSATTSAPPDSPDPHDVPSAYIDPNESAGLPGPSDKAYNRASHIVRAHTRGTPGKTRPSMFMNLNNMAAARGRRSRSPSRERDPERDAMPVNPRLRHGGGVLSALLTLYNAEQAGMQSTATTPGEELPERPWIERGKQRQQSSTSPSTRESSPSSPKDPLLHRSNSYNSLFGVRGRPKQQRSGGGTIASLIASTGNISGPAAPTQSRVAPNLKRPGYHLSRYSLESKLPNVKRPSPTGDIITRPVSAAVDGRDTPEMNALHLSPSSDTVSTLVGHGNEKIGSPPNEKAPIGHRRGWSAKLKDLPYASSVMSLGRYTPSQTPINTPSKELDDPFSSGARTPDRRERERRKRKKAEIYITRHVAEIIQRQEFILRLARAMMMFGAPSHRLQSQIAATGRVLDIEVSCMYLPDVMLISFDDSSTGTSSIRFIRQGSGLDLGKLAEAYELYWKVIHDDISVSDASNQLTELMKRHQIYPWWMLMFIGGMCSAGICTVSFNGSFLDAVAVFPMGAILVGMQLLAARNDLFSNVFEIVITMAFSFIAGGLAESHQLCYSAIASSSVVLILPGFFVLCGALEIMSRNIVSGSVRLVFAVIYALFLGFGLAIGAKAYQRIIGNDIVGITDYTCQESHDPTGGWWQQTPSKWWAFLSVPIFTTFLSLRNFARWNKKELPLLIAIASVGWTVNHFTSLEFVNQSDIAAAVGAFAVGIVANLYARFFDGNAFVVMITGILFQVPSGLGAGGLLGFVSEQSSGSSQSYLSGFQTGLQLVSVAIGLTVGLGLALLVVHPIPSRKRGGAVFSL